MIRFKVRNRLTKGYYYLFGLLYFSIETLLFGTNYDRRFQIMMVLLTMIIELAMISGWIFKFGSTLKISANFGLYVLINIILLLLTLISSLIRGQSDIEIQYIYHLLILVVAFTFAHQVNIKDFIRYYVEIVTFISVCSIALYILDALGILSHLPSLSVQNTSGYQYKHYFVGVLQPELWSATKRSYSIFREPGVFASILSIALCFEMFMKRNTSILRCAVLAVAIILTFSTAGYIALAMIMTVFAALTKVSTIRDRALKVLIILVSILIFAIGISESMNNSVFGKLFTNNETLNSRVYSIVAGFEYSLQRPLFGSGWKSVINEFTDYARVAFGVKSVHFTNTVFRMACTYGWVMTVGIFAMTFRFFHIAKKKGVSSLFLILFWIIALSNENFLLNIILYLVAFYGVSNTVIRRKKIT